MLIISTIKEVPSGKPLSIVRAIYLFPGAICAMILGFSGQGVLTNDEIISNLIKNLNTTETWTETIAQTNQITLQNEIWITVHFLIFIVIVIYIISQILILLGKKGTE